MSCSCNSDPCVCTQCPEVCPDLIQQECRNVNLVGIGVYDSENEGVFRFRGLRGGDSSVQVTYNVALGTVDLTNLAFDDNPTQVFANAGARAAATPDFIGQLAIQADTLIAYTANGLAAGNWALTISNGQPLNADLTAIAALATTGLVVRTAANTFVTRTITGDAKVSVANGGGVLGDPTFTVLEAGLDKNAIGGSVLAIVNGGTGTATGYSEQFGSAVSTHGNNTNFDVEGTECTVLVDTSLGDIQVNLPDAADFPGQIFVIKNISSSGINAKINPVTNLDGSGSLLNLTDLQSIKIQSDGTDFWILSMRA